ncbi:MAG: hypothetical protein HY582_01380, partial [Candidatus Omnitrophica bacterium]|nr:hypothetical protein [Candidatus Omnitrophota bacterium]
VTIFVLTIFTALSISSISIAAEVPSSNLPQTSEEKVAAPNKIPEVRSQSFGILTARERGVSKIDSAKGIATPTFDPALNDDVLEFDYSLPQGATASVWLKNFPEALTLDQINTIKIGIKAGDLQPLTQASVSFEIKGTQGTQIIPLQLKRGWSSLEQSIDWGKIGDLSEVQFVVSSIGTEESVSGTLSLALNFFGKSAPPKIAAPAAIPAEKPSSEVAKPAVKIPAVQTPAAPPRTSFNLLDAHDRGVTPTGSAKGTVTLTYDEAVGKDVLEFDYSIPRESSVSAWTKNFPPELGVGAVDVVRIGVMVLKTDQANQISVNAIIKGDRNAQTIPLKLKRGWNSFQGPVDWGVIGHLSEVAFDVSQVGNDELVTGMLSFSYQFVKRASSVQANAPTQTFSFGYNLMDAGAKGVFNIGPSQGNVASAFDETLARDVWEFSYSIPKGSIIGVWTQNYPKELGASSADAVVIGIMAPQAEQLDQVGVRVEVKGNKGMQSIPLRLEPGWNFVREQVNWNTIGNLKEAVFVVSPMAVGPLSISPIGVSPMEIGAPVTGKLYFDLGFGKLTFIEKHFTYIKVASVILMSFLFAFFITFFGNLFSGNSTATSIKTGSDKTPLDSSKTPIFSRLKRDFFYGTMAVLISGVALAIYLLGTMNPMDIDFWFLIVGLMGAVIGELFKFKFTGKHLTASEVFLNIFFTGLLAASSSKQALLQAPATWMQVLMLSNVLATLAFLIYQIANACSLGSSGKQLKVMTTAFIIGTPYLLGWLLLVENGNLLQNLSNLLTFGLLARWPIILEIIGRILIVFGFNEAVINGISHVKKGRLVTAPKAHWFAFFVSMSVALAPEIADFGSTSFVGALPVQLRSLATILATMFSYAGLWGEVYLITGMIVDGIYVTAPSEETISKHVTSGMKKGMAYSGILVALLYVLKMLLDASAAQTVMNMFPIGVGILGGALLFPLLSTIIETFDGSLPFFERVRYSYRNPVLYARGIVAGFGFAFMIAYGFFERAMVERINFGLLIGVVASGGVSFLRDIVYTFRGQGKIQTWRLYLTDSLLGIFVGSALAFYLDARQVPVIIEKFKLYTSAGFSPVEYITYPLVNKWGRIHLGSYTGGAKLLFTESLAGVINWSIAAWLFAINKVFLQAYFEKHTAPIKFFFSKAGFVELVNHMLYVLRWGLWMSPIIFTFLRMMPEPTWYNQ